MRRVLDWLRQYITLILVLLAGLLGGGAVFYATANGPWGFSDSVSYLVSARSLLRGAGLGMTYPDGSFHWETHFPPLYSLSLALFAAPGWDLVSTARWLSLILYVLTILGTGLLLYRFCSARAVAVIAAVLVAIFPTMFNMFSAAMSEPLFIFLFVWAVFALLQYLEMPRPAWFFAAVLLTGLLPLTRYIGVALPAVMSLAVWLFRPGDWRVRLGRALSFAVLSALPALAWFAWVRTRVDSTVGGRVVILSAEHVTTTLRYFYAVLIKLLWGWLPFSDALPALPGNLKLLLIALAVGLVVFLTWRAGRKPAEPPAASRAFLVFALFIPIYLAALLAACLLTIPRPDIDNRMLLPVYLATILALAAALSTWQALFTRRQGLGLATAGLVLLACFAWSDLAIDAPLMAALHHNDTMTSESWRDAPIMAAVRALPPDATLISSASTEILIWADRPSYDFVETMGSAILDMTGPYGSDPSSPVQKIFRNKGSILIIFNGVRPQIDRRYGSQGDARLDSLLAGLDVYANFSNGTFYTYPLTPKKRTP